MLDSVSKCHLHWDGTPDHQVMKFVCAADTKDPEVIIDFYPVCTVNYVASPPYGG